MVISGNELLRYIRYLIRDPQQPTRSGVLYTDAYIISTFNNIIRRSALALAKIGLYHHIAGMIRDVVIPLPLPAVISLPNDALWGIALNIEGRDIPVYNSGTDIMWGEQGVSDISRYYASIDWDTRNLHVFLPPDVGPQSGNAVFVYIADNQVLSIPSSVLYGCSMTFYNWVADRTALYLLQPDIGIIGSDNAVQGDAVHSLLQKINTLTMSILERNGVVLPPYELSQ